jgi:4-hydroxybenzoate polyprenyltransferase
MRGVDRMAQDIRELSTDKLKKRIKAATIILSVCWGAVIVCMMIALLMGKFTAIGAGAVGVIGLFVATIAMLVGVKKAKEEIARRDKSPGS